MKLLTGSAYPFSSVDEDERGIKSLMVRCSILSSQ